VTDDSEKIELRKKIAQAEKRLCAAQAKIAGINQRVANFEKAEAALMKFYTRGPHKKKKSGRPTFWKSPHGLFFVQEVERIAKERKCKTATAIRAARTATIRWAEQAEARGIKGPVIARAARLANSQTTPHCSHDTRKLESFGFSWLTPRHIGENKKFLSTISSRPLRHCRKDLRAILMTFRKVF
jgi:hypothetical protein